MVWLEEKEGSVVLKVLVQPRSSRNALVGVQGDCLKITLTAPPVEGRANEKLCEFLSAVLDVKKSRIEIIGGRTGRSKRVRVTGCTPEEVRRKLQYLI